MPKSKELGELFRAIGAHDLDRAAALARALATQHGSRGQYRAERDLLNALNGAAHPPPNGSVVSTASWSLNSAIMPLASNQRLADLELTHGMRTSFQELLKEWKGSKLLAQHGIPRRWRLLLHGPSGCGKSAAATALANEAELPAFLVRFDSLIGAYLGQTALRLREVFRFAEQTACVLLFDEVDALAKRRGNPMEVGELDRIVIAFMQELEHTRANGFIVATSNLPTVLDDALWRRFDLRLGFPKPKPSDLVRFANRSSHNFGFRASPAVLMRCKRSASYADAEQILLAEARRRVLDSSN